MRVRRSTKLLKTGLQGLFLFVSVSTAYADVSGGTNDPKLLFEKMLLAKTSVRYSGSLAYERGDQLFSYSIESADQFPTGVKTLMSLNGPEKTYELKNELDCSISFDSSFDNSAEKFSDWYNFSYVGPSRVAGRDAHEITLSPVDPYRLAYSFVVDQNTGLMLRSVTMLPDRRALERIEFVELEVLPEPEIEPESENENKAAALNPESVEADVVEVDATEVDTELAEGDEAAEVVDTQNLPDENDLCGQAPETPGWVANWVPEGFQLIKESQQTDQYSMVYGDGISTFSIFIEPMDELGLPIGSTQQGALILVINYYAAAGETYVVTFVGEVPLAAAQRVLGNLDRKR